MKYICLGYYDEKQWATIPESERIAAHGHVLHLRRRTEETRPLRRRRCAARRRGATTLRWKNGKVVRHRRPVRGNQGTVGRILVLDADDLNHAVH